eukprot:Skav228331  [mRNA]  locus=scaffold4117:383200:390152:+ [translate_table: standard]
MLTLVPIEQAVEVKMEKEHSPVQEETAQDNTGMEVEDLLADFDSPRDPSSDAAEVSFDLSTSPSNEESGGFFISTGGGGLNLPLDDDDNTFKVPRHDAPWIYPLVSSQPGEAQGALRRKNNSGYS